MLKNVDGNVFAFYIKLAATLKIRKKKKLWTYLTAIKKKNMFNENSYAFHKQKDMHAVTSYQNEKKKHQVDLHFLLFSVLFVFLLS